jgi:hypothetical protein
LKYTLLLLLPVVVLVVLLVVVVTPPLYVPNVGELGVLHSACFAASCWKGGKVSTVAVLGSAHMPVRTLHIVSSAATAGYPTTGVAHSLKPTSITDPSVRNLKDIVLLTSSVAGNVLDPQYFSAPST